jgi:two-component system, NarL family, invasion response regulator UvrY
MHRAGPDDSAEPEVRRDSPVAVLLVDDHEIFRSAMRDLISGTEGFELVGEAASGEDALEAVDELTPRLVIMDKRMPGMGGIEASRVLTARHPEIVVLLVSVEDPEPQVIQSCGAAAGARKQELSTALLRDMWRTHGI